MSFLINGLDQKPMERINKSVINKKSIPVRKPKASPKAHTTKGTTAPPTIPVTSIPEKDPWDSATEFRAKEMTIDHIVAIKNPINGNDSSACSLLPKRANISAIIVANDVPMITFLLSINFKRIRPKSVPNVIIPQKLEIVFAP